MICILFLRDIRKLCFKRDLLKTPIQDSRILIAFDVFIQVFVTLSEKCEEKFENVIIGIVLFSGTPFCSENAVSL